MSIEQKGVPLVDFGQEHDWSFNPADLEESVGAPVKLHRVEAPDGFRTERYDEINHEINRLMAMGDSDGNTSIAAAIARKRKSSIDYQNPATRELLRLVEGVEHWLDLVPTAAALHPIYNPDSNELPGGQPMTEDLRHWLGNLLDGIGIRSRAEVVRMVMSDEVLRRGGGGQWLSLACGAAQPVFRALERVRDYGMTMPKAVLADYDKRILSLASSYARSAGLSEYTRLQRMNVLNANGLTAPSLMDPFARALGSRQKLQAGSYDVVEAVGILEYLKEDDWPYTYRGVITRNHNMSGAKTLLRNAYELTKPGGLLLVGNMLDTHPQLAFTLNVVQWPHIQPRSIEHMAEIIHDSGVTPESLDIYCPSDGVYALYAMRKPVATV